MVIKYFTFEQYHNRTAVGSTKLRAHNLIKNWPEANLYNYGEKADVMIFQKVYCTYDYKYPAHFKGISILDTCDLDWYATPDIYIKETLDAMDAVTASTEGLKDLLQQMTDTPVFHIKDRFDLTEFPKPKVPKGRLKSVAWFGYQQNAELLKFAIISLEKRGIKLTVISNEDPTAYKWANEPREYEPKYTYVKFRQETLYEELQKHDAVILPKGYRPQDVYKSENKTIIANLCGLPVVTNADELDAIMDAKDRTVTNIDELRVEYDCTKSVTEMKKIINEIIRNKA